MPMMITRVGSRLVMIDESNQHATNTASTTNSTSNNSGEQHPVPFFCHACFRSFMSTQPQCPGCGGGFVECMADRLGALLGGGGGMDIMYGMSDIEYTDDEYTDNSDNDSNSDHSGEDSDSSDNNSDNNGNNGTIQELLERHIRRHQTELERQGIAIPEDLSAHMEAVSRAITDHFTNLRRADNNSSRPPASTNNGENEDGDDGDNDNDNEEDEDDEEDDDDEDGDHQMRFAIPGPGGHPMVVIMSGPASMASMASLASMAGIVNFGSLGDPNNTNDNNESVLHPFLRMLGYHGDPRDYVNDPHRFATLLDSLFQSHSANSTHVPMPDHDIALLARRPLAECDPDAVCPICMELLVASPSPVGVSVEMPCKHVFHESCLVPWLQRTATCPVCRATPPSQSSGASGDQEDGVKK